MIVTVVGNTGDEFSDLVVVQVARNLQEVEYCSGHNLFRDLFWPDYVTRVSEIFPSYHIHITIIFVIRDMIRMWNRQITNYSIIWCISIQHKGNIIVPICYTHVMMIIVVVCDVVENCVFHTIFLNSDWRPWRMDRVTYYCICSRIYHRGDVIIHVSKCTTDDYMCYMQYYTGDILQAQGGLKE